MTLGFKYLARTTVMAVVVMGALHVSNVTNMTHFNATGAKAMADLIAPKIVR